MLNDFIILLGIIFAIALATACGGAGAPAPAAETKQSAVQNEKAAKPEPFLRLEPLIWKTAADVEASCEEGLKKAKAYREGLLAVSGERNLENTLLPINDILIELNGLNSLSELMANVHPDNDVRDTAEKCEQEAAKFHTEFNLDRQVYEALAAVQLASLDAEAHRFVELLLRDYRRAGVDKDEATRAELAQLNEEMVKVSQDFARRIRDGKLSIEVKKEDLKGLPEDFLATREPDANGKIAITTEYPDFIPVTTFAENEKVRRDIELKYLTRAYPENEETLKKIIDLRHAYATKLGYADWAAYNAEDKMVKDKAVIAKFIEQVASLARPRMKNDLKNLLARKKKDALTAKAVNVWDKSYYVNKIRAEKFDVDAEVVRSYFDFTRVKDGLLKLNEELFGVSFERVPNAATWHESVEVYNVREGGELVGRIYLDLHPRLGKFSHAAEFPLLAGIKGRQLPSASLVCNFPAPPASGPALMEHSEVTTFFHEFGHLMHNILGGRHEWVTLSGIACEMDFAEVPSQLMEEWAWDYDVLKRFAVHYKTGETIPQDLVLRMRKAEALGKGADVMQQMFYAGLSFDFYQSDPSALDPLDLLKKLQKKYSPYPYADGTYMYSSFGHLDSYNSAYYTYMWSLVIAKDIYNKFKERGTMDKAVVMAYRKAILEPGGAVDAKDMVQNFLGRQYAFDAFQAWLQE